MVTLALESGFGLGPRSWDAVLARLAGLRVVHGASDAAALRPPVVVAGHSLGGLRARIVAARHPALVAGVVLVDASHEDQEERFARVIPAELRARVAALRGGGPDEWPALAAAARAAGGLGDRPLVVVTGGRLEGAPPPEVFSFDDTFHSPFEDLLMFEALAYPQWRLLQRDLLRLSTRAEQRVSPRAGHGILAEDPELVAAAIQDVARAVEPG